jgi:putative zinc finger protein
MSHVDDGTLHAYLDGELTPVERERTDGHLAGCGACRARLEEERALIERASRLLEVASPPERAAPPLHELRRRPRRSRFMIPLAWAATVTLAIGVGWFARGGGSSPKRGESPQARLATQPRVDSIGARPAEPAHNQIAAAPPPTGRADLRRDQPTVPASVASDAAGAPTEPATREEAERQAPAAPPAAKSVEARGVAAAAPSHALVAPLDALHDGAVPRSAASWPIIEPGEAERHLGAAPGIIPGSTVLGWRRNPMDSSEIAVTQRIAGGVVWLFERRNDALAGAAPRAQGYVSNERLARYVRSLRIEIAGALPSDSLSQLLGLVR